MKKGVMNYSLTWMENDEEHEQLFCTKAGAIRAYIVLMYAHIEEGRNISSLKFWECYTTMKPAKDITTAVNRFLA